MSITRGTSSISGEKDESKNQSESATNLYNKNFVDFIKAPFKDAKKIIGLLEKRAPGLVPSPLRLASKSIGYLGVADYVGSNALKAENFLDTMINERNQELVKNYPKTSDSPYNTWNSLPPGFDEQYQAKALLSVLSLAHRGLNKVDDYVAPLIKALREAPNAAEIYHKLVNNSHLSLFNDISPTSTASINSHSAYLISVVTRAHPDLRKAAVDDFINHPSFQNELRKLQLDAGLSSHQTELLAITAGNQYERSKTTASTSALTSVIRHSLPKAAELKKSLVTLESALIQDLSSQNKEKSVILTTLHESTQDGRKLLIASIASQRRLDAIEDRKIMEQKMEKWSCQVSAIGGLGSRIAMMGGNRQMARQIDAISSGASSAMTGFALASTNPVMACVSLANAVLSFGGLFDDDDDDEDNGLSVISGQISQMHNDMMYSFKIVHQDMMLGFQAIQVDLAKGFGALMNRFDHVDQTLYAVQNALVEGYNRLSEQQVNIARQLSTQINETKRDLLIGLQAVRTDIMNGLQTISQGMVQNFTHVNVQLNRGFSHLDSKVQLLSQELRAQIAEQMLQQKEHTHGLQIQQRENSNMLQKHSLQLHESYRRKITSRHEKVVKARKDLQKNKTELATTVLLPEFPINELTKLMVAKDIQFSDKTDASLSAGHCALSAEAMCRELGSSENWAEANAFDVINLLRRYACENQFDASQKAKFQQSLIHLPTWKENMSAYVKWMHQQKSVDQAAINYLKKEAEACLQLLQTCYSLSQSSVIQSDFNCISNATESLGKAIEIQLMQYQHQLTAECKKRLRFMLEQHEIDRSRLKSDNENEFASHFEAQKGLADTLKISLIGEFDIHYARSVTYFVRPIDQVKLTHALLITQDKMPLIPQKLLQLEALGVGRIVFGYIYEQTQKQLIVTTQFQFAQKDRTIVLTEYKIGAAAEGDILASWKQFKRPTDTEIILSSQEQNEVNAIYQEVITGLRWQMNYKLQQDMQLPAIQQLIEVIEAQVGLLHMKFKLLFETYYDKPNNIVSETLKRLLTRKSLELILANYNGSEVHPYQSLKTVNDFYQQLGKKIIDALTDKSLYVDNATLNNALMLLENMILAQSSAEERVRYLNEIITKHPNIPMLYVLRGALQSKSTMPKALEDFTEASILQPDDNYIRLRRADCLLALGQWEKAADEYSTALDNIAQAMRLMTDHPIDLPHQLKDRLYLNHIVILTRRGDSYMAGKKYAAAYGDYDHTCQLIMDQPDLLYKRAYSYESLNQVGLAKVDYEKILHLAPDFAVAREGLARCLAKSDPAEALTHYLILAKQYPNISGLKLECAKLADINDVRILSWLQSVVDDNQTNIDDLLACGVLAGENYISIASQVYSRVRGRVDTPGQYEQCAEICSVLGNAEEYEKNKDNAMVIDKNASTNLVIQIPRQLIPYQVELQQYVNLSSAHSSIKVSAKLLPLRGVFGASLSIQSQQEVMEHESTSSISLSKNVMGGE
jgi:tetratricopeptide (TPR) repeat protein